MEKIINKIRANRLVAISVVASVLTIVGVNADVIRTVANTFITIGDILKPTF